MECRHRLCYLEDENNKGKKEQSMKITLRTQPMAPTEALKAAVDRALMKLRNPELTRAEVYMTTDHRDHVTKIRLHGRHIDLMAKAKAGNMYSALREAVKKLKTQLTKKKDSSCSF